MRKRLIGFVLLFLALVPWLGGCGGGTATNELKLAPVSALPVAMQNAPVNVREAYQFALANQETLQKIPCYCGCGAGHSGEAPHKSVKDCFVREVNPDGTVEWDEMGLG